jgi:hypothetical protein
VSSAADADELIRNALAISEPDYMLKRSLTGTKGEAVRGGLSQAIAIATYCTPFSILYWPGQ